MEVCGYASVEVMRHRQSAGPPEDAGNHHMCSQAMWYCAVQQDSSIICPPYFCCHATPSFLPWCMHPLPVDCLPCVCLVLSPSDGVIVGFTAVIIRMC